MANSQALQQIEHKIFSIRGKQVMLDRDLAVLYEVETKYLNRAFKRNIDRFFDDYFKLTKTELTELVTNCHRLNKLKHSSSLPYVFTLEGILQFTSILNSKIAINTNRHIIRVFIKFNTLITQDTNQELLNERLKRIEAETKLVKTEVAALKSKHKIDLNMQNMEINDLNDNVTEMLHLFNQFRDSNIVIKKNDDIGRG